MGSRGRAAAWHITGLAALVMWAPLCRADRPAAGPGGPQPAVRIPVDPLGYMPPSAFYVTYRLSSAALGFFDKDHLLFTFRVGGLLKREPGDPDGDDDQQIRAVVLDAHTGKVLKQTEWRMHDRSQYLWPFPDGKFLVRVRDSLYLTDESLTLEPYMTFPREIRAMQVSPDRRLLAIETVEPIKLKSQMGVPPGPEESGAPVKISIYPSGAKTPARVTEASGAALLPLMGDGLLDTLEGKQNASWVMRDVPFEGQPKILAQVKSTCQPSVQPVSATVALLMGCYGDEDDRPVVAVSEDGEELWHDRWQNRYVWGWFDYAENGSRFAYESVQVNRPISVFDSLDSEDITQQLVGVYDTQTGSLVIVRDASPVLTAGQNVALSADGRRFAVLRHGAVEIYDLPPVAPKQPAELVAKKKK